MTHIQYSYPILGIRIQLTFSLVLVERDRGIYTVIYHWLIVLLVFLHAVRRMSLDSWALGCPCSGNILLQRRMSLKKYEATASMRGDPELQP